jgi:hypothetical protein
MKYRITPLNVLAPLGVIFGIYDYSTNVNSDGLGGTALALFLGLVLVMLVIDLLIQKMINSYRWVLILESSIAAFIVWRIGGGLSF